MKKFLLLNDLNASWVKAQETRAKKNALIGKKIDLVWDAASPHTCQKVIEYVSEKGPVYEFIPAGLTFIMQICDLDANRPLKAAVIHWVEEAVSAVNKTQNSDRIIEYLFNKLGQDPTINSSKNT
ncbi:hypothetical protein ON010_g9211 [Phytophthora cinnamomi]|nr:hypothetical protein ON010_g9211 [Phytophthora cinnamomi]